LDVEENFFRKIPKELLMDMEKEGMSEAQVLNLLDELEMLDENGENSGAEDLDDGSGMLEELPLDILQSTQEIVEELSENHEHGYLASDSKGGHGELSRMAEHGGQENAGAGKTEQNWGGGRICGGQWW
jgi:hypothetical protein